VITRRDAEPADVDELVALVLRALATFSQWLPATWRPPDPERHAAHWRRQWDARMLDPDARAIVAHEPDGRLIAVVGFTQARTRSGAGAPIAGCGRVSVLFVDPGHWGCGLAGGLLAEAEVALRERAYDTVVLSTADGGPACGFYERRGYRRDGERAWYGPGALEVVGYTKPLR
jgi:GNAT superfamily N-acetyltransferase